MVLKDLTGEEFWRRTRSSYMLRSSTLSANRIYALFFLMFSSLKLMNDQLTIMTIFIGDHTLISLDLN